MHMGWDDSSGVAAFGLVANPAPFIRVRWIELNRDGDRLVDWGRGADAFVKEEMDRARRMESDRARRDFLASRAALRQLLGQEVGEPAYSERFLLTKSGKPRVQGANIHFSLSRTKELAVIAISSRPVGIDVERNERLSADLARKIRSSTDCLNVCFANSADARKKTSLNEIELWALLEAYSKLKDTRLAEHFSDWGSPGGTVDRLPSGSDRPVIAYTVQMPRGYRCFCCSEQSDAHLDVGEFEMDLV